MSQHLFAACLLRLLIDVALRIHSGLVIPLYTEALQAAST